MSPSPEQELQKETYIKFDRTCAIVEVVTREGLFIPLLWNPKRGGQWEVPGGGKEHDVEGEEKTRIVWKQYQALLSDHLLAKNEIDFTVVQDRWNAMMETITQRHQEWELLEIQRELREELGISEPPWALAQMTTPSKTFFLTSGRGRKLEIHSTAYIARYQVSSLPLFQPTHEHTQLIWTRWPGWEDRDSQHEAFLDLLYDCYSEKLSVFREKTEQPIFGLQVFDGVVDQQESLKISEVSAWALEEYFKDSFFNKKNME